MLLQSCFGFIYTSIAEGRESQIYFFARKGRPIYFFAHRGRERPMYFFACEGRLIHLFGHRERQMYFLLVKGDCFTFSLIEGKRHECNFLLVKGDWFTYLLIESERDRFFFSCRGEGVWSNHDVHISPQQRGSSHGLVSIRKSKQSWFYTVTKIAMTE